MQGPKYGFSRRIYNQGEWGNRFEMPTKHTIRTEKSTRTITLTPIKAIRAFCSECMCWQPKEIENCTDKLCPLYPYRFGKDPGQKRDLTDAQRDVLRKRAKKSFGHDSN